VVGVRGTDADRRIQLVVAEDVSEMVGRKRFRSAAKFAPIASCISANVISMPP